MKAKGYECLAPSGAGVEVPMVFIEIQTDEVGRSYKPRLVSWIDGNESQTHPWELRQMTLDPQLSQTFVVHIGARQPGIYTYKAEAVFKNRFGSYPPVMLQEERTIMFMATPDLPQRVPIPKFDLPDGFEPKFDFPDESEPPDKPVADQ
jgi:hypothetical protein